MQREFIIAVESGVSRDRALEILSRFESEEYKRPELLIEAEPFHFLHTSTEDENLWAYFPKIDSEKSTKIRPGKYLKKFFTSLTDSEICDILKEVFSQTRCRVKFTSDPDEIEHVYQNLQGSGSCMCLDDDYIEDHLQGIHPCRMYSKMDGIELAYTDDGYGTPMARCVTNSKTKKYSRIYQAHDEDENGDDLCSALEDLGYSGSSELLNGVEVDFSDSVFTGSECLYTQFPYLDGDVEFIKLNKYRTRGVLDIKSRHAGLYTFYCKSASGCGYCLGINRCYQCRENLGESDLGYCEMCVPLIQCPICNEKYSELFTEIGGCPNCYSATFEVRSADNSIVADFCGFSYYGASSPSVYIRAVGCERIDDFSEVFVKAVGDIYQNQGAKLIRIGGDSHFPFSKEMFSKIIETVKNYKKKEEPWQSCTLPVAPEPALARASIPCTFNLGTVVNADWN